MIEVGDVQTAEAVGPRFPPLEDRQLVKWISRQAPEDQGRIATECFKHFLEGAEQPRIASSNACIKLCYFLDQCKSSSSATIQGVAFDEHICLKLFDFYIMWSEKNQARSMRQVLELISSLLTKNPDAETALRLRTAITSRTLSIICHQAAQSLVKPAFKCLEYLIGKGTIAVHTLVAMKVEGTSVQNGIQNSAPVDAPWDNFFDALFEWMSLPDISPAAGRFIVTVFLALKKANKIPAVMEEQYASSWQRWISKGLAKYPDCLENVKNHIFAPLFKFDRPGSIILLSDIISTSSSDDNLSLNEETRQLLRLSAMEAGKKAGLLEESITLDCFSTTKKSSTIALDEDVLKPLVLHSSDSVRSLAFSVLVSSLSSIRPFTMVALEILKSCLEVLHLDPDAKFRNEVLSNTKHMIERLRGATSLMAKEVENLSHRPNTIKDIVSNQAEGQNKQNDQIAVLSKAHREFLDWYLNFLLQELTSTASYQRHITALRAISILLQSGIHKEVKKSAPLPGNATSWPFSIPFFTARTVALLMDLLLDPFEDVRHASARILGFASTKDFNRQRISGSSIISQGVEFLKFEEATDSTFEQGSRIETTEDNSSLQKSNAYERNHDRKTGAAADEPLGTLVDFIERAQTLSKQTGRADYADGLACALELLCNFRSSAQERYDLVLQLLEGLEEKIECAEKNLGQAVLDTPVHGDFASLRLVWECLTSRTPSTKFSDLDSTTPQSQFESGSQSCLPEPALALNGKPAPAGILHLASSSSDLRNAVHNLPANSDPAFPLLLVQQRMINACLRIWKVVKIILCDDSPEGLLPENFDEGDEGEALDTKNVLSYSFRAVHESSNLLRSIATKIKIILPENKPLLPYDLFKQIGDLTFEQLSNLRHRGAFSTVSLTFTTCCELTQYKGAGSKMPGDLLGDWRKAAFECIQEQQSTTRRSGGIPYLITGAVAADWHTVENVIKDLISIAKSPLPNSNVDHTHLPQVHAMNSLKEAFKSSSVGSECEPFREECLQLAVDSLNSDIYPIRNCGLLLLQSIINHLFGTSASKSEVDEGWDGRSIKLDYQKYPHLAKRLQDILRSVSQLGQNSTDYTEVVLPIMEILRRAGPPKDDQGELARQISYYFGHTHWAIRDMAARAFCALTMGASLKSLINHLLDPNFLLNKDKNHRHGAYLAGKYIVMRRAGIDHLNLNMQVVNGGGSNGLFTFEEVDHLCENAYTSEHTGSGNDILEAAVLDIRGALYSASLVFKVPMPSVLKLSNHLLDHYQAETPHRTPAVRLAFARQSLFMAALGGTFNLIPRIIKEAVKTIDSDGALGLKLAVDSVGSYDPDFARIFAVYGLLYKRYDSDDVRAVALSGMCDILHANMRSLQNQSDVCELILHFAKQMKSGSPGLVVQQVRFSGMAIKARVVQVLQGVPGAKEELAGEMSRWASSLELAMGPDETYDTRFAAATAILYGLHSPAPQHPELVRVFFTLYDVLNDDDEDIRKIGARAFEYVSKSQLAPLPAMRSLFKDHLLPKCGRDPVFVNELVVRLVGSKNFESVNNLLDHVQLDGQLFAVEKANLYQDIKRDIKLWAEIFGGLSGRVNLVQGGDEPLWASLPVQRMLNWTIDGLESLLWAEEEGNQAFSWSEGYQEARLRLVWCSQTLLGYERFANAGGPVVDYGFGDFNNWVTRMAKLRNLSVQWDKMPEH